MNIRDAQKFLESINARSGKTQAVNTAEAVRKSESKSVDSAALAEDVRSLARLERTDDASEGITSLLVMLSR